MIILRRVVILAMIIVRMIVTIMENNMETLRPKNIIPITILITMGTIIVTVIVIMIVTIMEKHGNYQGDKRNVRPVRILVVSFHNTLQAVELNLTIRNTVSVGSIPHPVMGTTRDYCRYIKALLSPY